MARPIIGSFHYRPAGPMRLWSVDKKRRCRWFDFDASLIDVEYPTKPVILRTPLGRERVATSGRYAARGCLICVVRRPGPASVLRRPVTMATNAVSDGPSRLSYRGPSPVAIARVLGVIATITGLAIFGAW